MRELAILATAREHDSQFEWAAHEPAALAEDIPPDIIDSDPLAATSTAGLAEPRRDRHRPRARNLCRAPVSSPLTYARALQQFGPRALVHLVALMGNYASTAALLTAFAMQLDEGQPPPLPRLFFPGR